ncbi:hypothetical protein M378DRAFT_170583 [Amanita muscaria Koide BX008]|uniref:Uncharacterized protein n=1 Tax=Amanita muscaria (strain Koide BX008) TaxID=946122 RepID=A0A0C2WAY8_AMAMK|nr:hypothetical protein M378DRAFT_170583 [Amanita muscaria Koide BX008]
MSTSLSLRVASTLADLDMPTAQLVIELALDDLYQLPDDEFNSNRVLSNLEYALAEQEREFMRYRSVYGFSQSNSVAASGSLSNVGITDTGNSGNGTHQGGHEGPSHGTDLFDDLPSIRSETDTLPDNEDEDDPCPYDDLPSIRSETSELPDDIANDSRPGSAYYLEKPKGLEYLPSIRSETSTFSRDEDDDDDPVSDDAYTLADGNGHYDDLPSICSETRALSEDDYSLVDSGLPTDSMSQLGNSRIQLPNYCSTVSGGVIGGFRADTPISPESLVADVHDASVPTGAGMMHSLHRCSKALLNAIDGIGCIRWRRIKHGILGSIWAPQTQSSSEPSP